MNTGRTHFKEGNTGGGRTPMSEEFKTIVKENSVPAIKYIVSLINDSKVKHDYRIKACEIVIDRAYGKAPQAITGAEGEPLGLKVTVETIERNKQDNINGDKR